MHDWDPEDESPTDSLSTNDKDNDDDSRTSRSSNTSDDLLTPQHVVERIESVTAALLEALDEERLPVLEGIDDPSSSSSTFSAKRFTLNQCRTFTSLVLVLSYCHALLLSNRTTTIREVYYHYVTHFRSQRECDMAVWDVAALLKVPRDALGLKASTRGWFCGDIQLVEAGRGIVLDGRALQALQGSPISSDWLKSPSARNFDFQTTAAQFILVIEKEGVFGRLSEDRFFDRFPCIMVTGKGFPDLATRAMVHSLHRQLRLPVYGLADCNPFGVMVLHTYQYSERCRGLDGGDRYAVPMQWIGLRPSQIAAWQEQSSTALPDEVFQALTELDQKRLQDHLLSENHRWSNFGQNERRVEELQDMVQYKVELEALNWLGMEFCTQWLSRIFDYRQRQEQRRRRQRRRHESESHGDDSDGGDDEEDDDDDESVDETLEII